MPYALDNMVRSSLTSERAGSGGNAYPYEINFSIADTVTHMHKYSSSDRHRRGSTGSVGKYQTECIMGGVVDAECEIYACRLSISRLSP